MLYREETHYVKMKGASEEAPPHCDEFVECLRNALKIMENKYTPSTKEQSYGSDKGNE